MVRADRCPRIISQQALPVRLQGHLNSSCKICKNGWRISPKIQYSIFTRFPKDRNCVVCKKTKITRAPCRKRTGSTEWLENSRSQIPQYNRTRVKLNLLWRRRRVYGSFSSRRKSWKSFILTIPWNLAKACEELSWNHCASTPHRSETHGIAERAARRMKEGTSAVLLQSGLDEKWWADSMECYCYLRNVQDLFSDGKTLYERRFGEPFQGPVIPFGSMMEYHPIFLPKTSQDTTNSVRKLYLEYSLDMHEMRGGIWKGDILVADIEEPEHLDVSETMSGDSMHRKSSCRQMVNISSSRSQMEQLSCLEEISFRKFILILDYSARGQEHKGDLQESDECSTKRFLVGRRKLPSSSSRWTKR